MIESSERLKLVGDFIKKRRELLGMSQRALGLLFDPPVTTQFISNVERGVTPLPPSHIPMLAKALQASNAEMKALLEKEYALKLNMRLGTSDDGQKNGAVDLPNLVVSTTDYELMKNVYDAYRSADPKTRQAFATICESILKLPKVTLHTP